MKCPKCGSSVAENSSFCQDCGMPLVKKNKKNHDQTIIIIIVLILIIISTIIIIFSKDEISPKIDNSNTVSGTNENTIKEKTVNYAGYTFTYPSDLVASVEPHLLITDIENMLALALIYDDTTDFETLYSNQNQIIDILKMQNENQIYNFDKAWTEEMKFSGTTFIVTKNIRQNEIYLDITYAKAENGVFVISIAKTNSQITENDRQKMYSIISSANLISF